MDELKITRGGVYWVELIGSREDDSSQQRGMRPGIVVSNDSANIFSPLITVVPMTTRTKKELPTHYFISHEKLYGTALCEQILLVERDKLKGKIVTLTEEEMYGVEKGLQVQLGFKRADFSQVIEAFKRLEDMISFQSEKIKDLEDYIRLDKKEEEKIEIKEVEPVKQKRVYKKRSKEEVEDFIREWELDCNDKKEVAEVFGFSSVVTAYQFYKRKKEIA